MDIWISQSFLEWPMSMDGSRAASEDDAELSKLMRAWEFWQHAEKLLKSSPDNHQRADAVAALKRAIHQREESLDEIYQFNRIPLKQKPKGREQQLAYFGIIRPFMLRRIVDIRNAIEHRYSEPPSRDRCFEFLDLVWYFLKSTDLRFTMIPVAFSFSNPNGKWMDQWVELNTGPDYDWQLEVSGTLPETAILSSPRPMALHIRLKENMLCNGPSPVPALTKKDVPGMRRVNRGVQFSGVVVGPVEQIKKLLGIYFLSFSE